MQREKRTKATADVFHSHSLMGVAKEFGFRKVLSDTSGVVAEVSVVFSFVELPRSEVEQRCKEVVLAYVLGTALIEVPKD